MIGRNKQERAGQLEAATQRLDDCGASSISLLALNPVRLSSTNTTTTQEVSQ